MNRLKRFWQVSVPPRILFFIRFLIEPGASRKRRKQVIQFFSNKNSAKTDPDIKEGLQFLRSNKYSPFPYKWTLKYDLLFPEVFRDEQLNRIYVFFEGKRMYFPETYDELRAVRTLRSILKEQDLQSPHLYLTTLLFLNYV